MKKCPPQYTATDNKELFDALNRIANSGDKKPATRVDRNTASTFVEPAEHLLDRAGCHMFLSYKLSDDAGDYLSGSLTMRVDHVGEVIRLLKQSFEFAMH